MQGSNPRSYDVQLLSDGRWRLSQIERGTEVGHANYPASDEGWSHACADGAQWALDGSMPGPAIERLLRDLGDHIDVELNPGPRRNGFVLVSFRLEDGAVELCVVNADQQPTIDALRKCADLLERGDRR